MPFPKSYSTAQLGGLITQPYVGRPQASFGVATDWDVPMIRQMTGAGLAANPSANFVQNVIPGSIIVAWGTSESAGAGKTFSSLFGCQWSVVTTLNSSAGGMFTALWIGRVLPSPGHTTITMTSSPSTSGFIAAEFVGLKGKIREDFALQQGHGTMAARAPVFAQGVQIGLSGHRGGTPGLPGVTGDTDWQYIHQRNNDLSMVWQPLWKQNSLTWGGGPSSNQIAGLVAIV